MDKKLLNNLLLLIFIFIILLFSLIGLSIYSFGWFAGNINVNSANTKIEIHSRDQVGCLSCIVYKYENGEIIEQDLKENSVIQMNEYDQIFTERNKYTAVILKFEIFSSDNKPISIKLKRNIYNDNKIYSSQVLFFKEAQINLDEYYSLKEYFEENIEPSYFSGDSLIFDNIQTEDNHFVYIYVDYDSDLINDKISNAVLNQDIEIHSDISQIEFYLTNQN